jgi:ABC-2 type transport system permease protein
MNTILLLAQRELLHYSRAKARVIASLATPAMVYLFARAGGGGEFFFAGSLALVILFSAIFSAFSLIEDRNQGFLQGVLVSPAQSYEIALGKILGGAILSSLQALVFMAFQPHHWHLMVLPVIALTSLACAGLGLAVAWPCATASAFHSLMNLILMPMWLLSGALFPAQQAHPLMALAIKINPFTHCLESLRQALEGHSPSLSFPLAFALLMLTSAVAVVSSQRQKGPQ